MRADGACNADAAASAGLAVARRTAMEGRPKATRSFRAKHSALYASERDCARYDVLCNRQDHAGNTLAELKSLIAGNTLASLHVVDIGTGTGKLARLLAPHVQSVSAFDHRVRRRGCVDRLQKYG